MPCVLCCLQVYDITGWDIFAVSFGPDLRLMIPGVGNRGLLCPRHCAKARVHPGSRA
jgi:hypothetical protein